MSNTISYSALIRGNRNFRWLWAGMMISLFGDWFNMIALYDMMGEMSKSPLSLAIVFVLKALPFAIFAPLGGIVADRLDRKKVMLAMDLVRATVVLLLIWANETKNVPLTFVLVTIQTAATAFFHPAYQALFPHIVKEDEMLTASALLSATWSVLLASGAALGGLALTIFPRWSVLLVDSASYILSAACIWQLTVSSKPPKSFDQHWIRQGYAGILEGWQFLRTHHKVRHLALAKSAWASGGGALVFMLSLLGMQLLPNQPALGIGLLYSARGLGTGLGPVIARNTLKDQNLWARAIGFAVVISSWVYALAGSQVLPLVATIACVSIAHALSGANWVLSSVLLQKQAPDEFRGRIMSTELLFVTLIESSVTLLAGFLLYKNYLPLTHSFYLFAGIQFIFGCLWIKSHPILKKPVSN